MDAVEFKNTTDFLSDKLFTEHYKLYKGYVDKVNEITKDLKLNGKKEDANATYSVYRGLKKGEAYALDGVLLHELYFQNIGDGGVPKESTLQLFDKFFGGLENFKRDMTACAKAARGWAVLVYEQRSGEFRIILQDTHDDGVILMAYPILVLDMYEHAYALDYGTDKSSYIKKFLNNLNWEVIERRLRTVG